MTYFFIFVEGYSGDSYDRSRTLKDSMCGDSNLLNSITSTRRRIWIRFKSTSNRFHAERGFVIGYVMYDDISCKCSVFIHYVT